MKNKIILFLTIILSSLSNTFCAKDSKTASQETKQLQKAQQEIKNNAKEKPQPKTKKTTTLSMDQAVQMAYEYKPSLKALNFAIKASKEDEKKALAGYFPQVTFQDIVYTSKGGISDVTGSVVSRGGANVANNFAVQATQLIYSFAGPLESRRIARKGTEITQYTQEQQKDLVRYNVEVSFLQSWLLQKKAALIKSLNQSSIQNIKKAEHQNQVNLLGKNDWLKDASGYAQNQATVFYYPDELNNAQSQLEYLIGKQFNGDTETICLEWDSNQEIKLESIENYFQKALKYRKELKEKQKEIELQAESQSFYKKSYLPSVSLSGNVVRNAGTASSIINLNFNWSISDGGANFHESNKASANKLKAILEKDELTKQVKYDVQKSYYDLSTILKQLEAKNIQLAQAQNEFNLNELQFKVGLLSKVDFENSKFNWESQRFDWLTLKISAAIKERDLSFACGYPNEIV
jgi:outer membrane protein